jgi:hypothetical protein
VVGVIGSAAEAAARAGVDQPSTYHQGSLRGTATVRDLMALGTIDPSWLDCSYLHELARYVKAKADLVGDSGTPNTALGDAANPKIVYIEGDYTVNGGHNPGAGLLWVTGKLTLTGSASYTGPMFIIGQGVLRRSGGGAGVMAGANVVANIAGADRQMWTADDCDGPDGIRGTADDGIGPGAAWDASGGGNNQTIYCSSSTDGGLDLIPMRPVAFRQR